MNDDSSHNGLDGMLQYAQSANSSSSAILKSFHERSARLKPALRLSTDMHNQSYKYKPFDDNSNQVRLVRLLPRQGTKEVRLEFEIASLNEVQGQYEAVSYMWGSECPVRHVVVDGRKLKVRSNIWCCLKHLRDLNLTESRLWIDAICINQGDVPEKNQQVAKMGQIFQFASKVLIWLGSTSLQTYLHDPGTSTLRNSIEALPPENCDCWTAVLGHSDSPSRSLEDQIMSIVYNPYWHRLWIVQEVALARRAFIVFGNTLLGKDYIDAIYSAARTNSKPGYRSWIVRQRDPGIENSGTALLDHHPMQRAEENNGTAQKYKEADLLGQMIGSYHWQRCTDPRDYVFGLANLLHPSPRFKVDYTSSNEEIAIEALEYLDAEGNPEKEHSLGLDLSAAAALLKALTVTSSTYLRARQELSSDRTGAFEALNFHLCFKPMQVLIPDDSVKCPETKADKVLFQSEISGSLWQNIYLVEHDKTMTVKLLNAQVKGFTNVRPHHSGSTDARNSTQPEATPNVVLLCFLHFTAAVMIRRSSSGDGTSEIEHFISPDQTRPFQENPPWLEVRLPESARGGLEREINKCRINWNDLTQVTSPKSFLHLSTLETISLCESIAPKASDLVEFWKNSA